MKIQLEDGKLSLTTDMSIFAKESTDYSIIIDDRYHQEPFERGTLFLFCGGHSNRIKESL